MSLLDDIGDRLTTDGVVDGANWILGKSFIPSEPDQVVSIHETGGEDPDQFSPASGVVTFQVQVRGKTFEYDIARTKMQAVFDSLNDATIAGHTYTFSMQSGPLSLGVDGNNRPELAINFRARKISL